MALNHFKLVDEYLPRFVMFPSSQKMESPAIPGQFNMEFSCIIQALLFEGLFFHHGN